MLGWWHKITMGWSLGFPGGSDSKESSCNVGDLDWEDPLEEVMATHSSIFPGESHGQRSLVGYGP